tara:strand:+ start:1179 stop:1532 length:354 start_codon:yes stop_codon:yes gene_type:complete
MRNPIAVAEARLADIAELIVVIDSNSVTHNRISRIGVKPINAASDQSVLILGSLQSRHAPSNIKARINKFSSLWKGHAVQQALPSTAPPACSSICLIKEMLTIYTMLKHKQYMTNVL